MIKQTNKKFPFIVVRAEWLKKAKQGNYMFFCVHKVYAYEKQREGVKSVRRGRGYSLKR